MRGNFISKFSCCKVVNECVEFCRSHFESVPIVHLQARSFSTGRLAFSVFQSNETIGSSASCLDAKSLLGMMHEFLGAHERTRHSAANIEEILPYWFKLEHLVERSRSKYFCRSYSHKFSNVLHGILCHITVLLLSKMQNRNECRLRTWVTSNNFICNCNICIGEAAHRSTSPNTGSIEEITATASAMRPSRIMCGSA